MPECDTAPIGSPAAFRRFLLEEPQRAASWVDDLLSPRQVVAEYPLIGGSVGTLANQRSAGRGPRYLKVGGSVAYRRLDLLEYLERHLVDPEAVGRKS